MAKIELNTEIPMPVSMTIHDLVIACGYSLIQQQTNNLLYHKLNHAVIIDRLDSGDISLKLATPKNHCTVTSNLNDEQLALILQATGAIDFTTLKEFKDGQHFANNSGFDADHIGLVNPGGNTGFFGVRSDKGNSTRH